jgi:hypothetical protein
MVIGWYSWPSRYPTRHYLFFYLYQAIAVYYPQHCSAVNWNPMEGSFTHGVHNRDNHVVRIHAGQRAYCTKSCIMAGTLTSRILRT